MLNRVSLAVCLSFLLTSGAFAQSTSTEALQAQSFPIPPIMARAGIVVDGDSGAVLASLNPHLHLPMASTTKIMTALLALKMGRLTDRVTVPKSAFNYEWDATVMGLHAGQVVTLTRSALRTAASIRRGCCQYHRHPLRRYRGKICSPDEPRSGPPRHERYALRQCSRLDGRGAPYVGLRPGEAGASTWSASQTSSRSRRPGPTTGAVTS